MSTAAESGSKERLRAAMESLRERGIENPDDLVRLGAAAMIENCVAAFDRRGNVGPGWLAKAVEHGGAWASTQRPASVDAADDGLTPRDRVRIAAFDSLMAERGLSLAG